jgi:hypothetical protein
VPALTFWVSANFALANLLASRSFGNVSVALACVRFPGPSSNETYHVPLDLPAMMRRSRGYAGGSPSATSRNFSEFCISPSVTSGTSIEGDRIRSACHLPVLRIRFLSLPYVGCIRTTSGEELTRSAASPAPPVFCREGSDVHSRPKDSGLTWGASIRVGVFQLSVRGFTGLAPAIDGVYRDHGDKNYG